MARHNRGVVSREPLDRGALGNDAPDKAMAVLDRAFLVCPPLVAVVDADALAALDPLVVLELVSAIGEHEHERW
ncbi:MAG: hypothetical protein RBS78_01900 [Coriobacteriia bacterium]|nr:hypothetical protein [Coriobacteriia bacterium]